MELNIRKVNPEDYNALCKLFDEVDSTHRENLPGLFQEHQGPARELDTYQELVADENVGLFVAEAGEQLLGYVHVIIRDTPAIPVFVPRRYALIDSIGVKSDFRHCGIGRKLIDTAHKWAIAKGATSIDLNVFVFNKAAIAFYEKIGYVVISHRMSKPLIR